MIKKSILLVGLATFMFACDSKEAVKTEAGETAKESEVVIENPNVTLKGTIKDGNGVALVLEALTDQGAVIINKVTTNGKGNFEVKGAIKEMGLYQLRVDNIPQGEQPKTIPLTLVPGDELTLNLDMDNFNFGVIYEGTEWAEAVNGYMKEMQDFIDWQSTIDNPQQYYTAERQGELMEMIMDNKKKMDHYIIREVSKNPSNPAHILLMTNLVPVGGFDFYDPKYLDVLVIIKDAYEEKYPEKVVTKSIAMQVKQLVQSYQDYKSFVLENKAPEIILPNPSGQEMKLSDLRGKYVLIDFWASWCQPCRVENPNVVRLYNKYKNKNFDIFSVSLDDNKEQWIKAIKDDGLVWKSHVSDLLKWKTPLVEKYQFNGIPHTVLIDPSGKIIAKNLRGLSLERKLQELLGS